MTNPPECSLLTPELKRALDTLVRVVERQSKSFRASVLLLADDGVHLVDAAAPSLPAPYREAIDGLEIGPATGSCGTAAYTGRRVVVSDTFSDPRWRPFQKLVRAHGLRACWSQPIYSGDGAVRGTFAMYYGDVAIPAEADLQVIGAAADRAGRMIDGALGGAPGEDLVSVAG